VPTFPSTSIPVLPSRQAVKRVESREETLKSNNEFIPGSVLFAKKKPKEKLETFFDA
jgi:hypothetical protein